MAKESMLRAPCTLGEHGHQEPPLWAAKAHPDSLGGDSHLGRQALRQERTRCTEGCLAPASQAVGCSGKQNLARKSLQSLGNSPKVSSPGACPGFADLSWWVALLVPGVQPQVSNAHALRGGSHRRPSQRAMFLKGPSSDLIRFPI